MTVMKTGLVLALFFLIPQASKLEKQIGQVMVVNGGDTISIQTARAGLLKIRLAEIDSPDLKQSFGREARLFTQELCLGKRVQVIYRMVDRFNRLIGEVVLPDGRVLNEEVVRYGYAWHYRVKPNPSSTLADLEYQAWKKKMGLWVEPSPVPPWEFRREKEIPSPPAEVSFMDYDSIFSYGIVGSPKTKTYFWPACKSYPGNPADFIIFGNKRDAENRGYKAHKTCPVF